MNNDIKPKRLYRKIDATTVARFKSEKALQGNGTAAVRVLEPEYKAPDLRAMKIEAKDSILSTDDYVERRIGQIAVEAIDRVGEMVMSTDEHIATKNAHFIIEHRRGKAVQRSLNLHGELTIESLLE